MGRAGGATYEHIDPEIVGNHTRVLVSDLGGKAGMAMKAEEFGVELDDRAVSALSEELKQLESRGWLFESADASLELLMRKATGWTQEFFEVEAYRVSSYHREGPVMPTGEIEIATEATIKLWVDGERLAAVGEGNGPVNALDVALRRALNGRFPALDRIHLTDYKVRVLDSVAATSAVVRVLIDSTDGDRSWTTVGVSENIIEASWAALVDSIIFGLLRSS